MRFLPKTTHFSLYATVFRQFSSATKLPRHPSLSKIPSKYRPQAIQEAQQALTDYLHSTRSLPFTYAEHISRNSLFSLSNVVAKVQFSPSTFSKSLARFLRYHPINEFEFFYESIGIDYREISGFLPENKFFLSEDSLVLNAACVLSGYGFPWNRLGKLYTEEVSIFRQDPDELGKKLHEFKGNGLNSATVIGMCLVFPCMLSGEPKKLAAEIDSLFEDLRKLIVDYDLMSSVEESVNAWYEVCRKIRVFYDLGCQKGSIGELMGRSKNIFIQFTEEFLVQNADFFCRLDVEKKDVGLLLLERPEIFYFDLKDRVISVSGLLKHFGMNAEDLKSIAEKFPYIRGRNKMINFPHVLRALDLHEWFFNKIRCGDHHLLSTYVIGNSDEDLDKDYKDRLDIIQSSRTPIHTISKLEFLHGIGFGENKLTLSILDQLHGSGSELQERFDCALEHGIRFSRLCKMLSFTPKMINQKPEILEQKMKFLCQKMGSSLQCLDAFPACLCYDLEKRIKPRYRFHTWLTENGLCRKTYTFASMIATSDKKFIARISGIHPAAPKLWFECFKPKSQ